MEALASSYTMTIMSSGLQMRHETRFVHLRTYQQYCFRYSSWIGCNCLYQSSFNNMMVIGFVNSGLMTLPEAIAVIMGANIGTTITAQITAFNLTAFAPVLLFAGCVMFLFIKNLRKIRRYDYPWFRYAFCRCRSDYDAIKLLSQSAEFKAFLSTLSNPALAFVWYRFYRPPAEFILIYRYLLTLQYRYRYKTEYSL